LWAHYANSIHNAIGLLLALSKNVSGNKNNKIKIYCCKPYKFEAYDYYVPTCPTNFLVLQVKNLCIKPVE